MGIWLDWEVESDGRRAAVEEDARIIAARQRHARQRRRRLIGGLALALFIAALIYSRYEVVRRARLEALIATVEAEALALRIGDQDKFMRLQGASEQWREEQLRSFTAMQALGASINVTGTILARQIIEDEAQVRVEIIVDGEPMAGVWLYEYTDKGWKHVATQEQPWGVRRTVGMGALTFTFDALNAAEVEPLQTLLAGWWAEATAATGSLDQLNLGIQIDPHADQVDLREGRYALVIPSSALVNAALDDPHDPLRVQLATLLADRWATHIMGVPRRANRFDVWMHWQLGLMLQQSFGLPLDPLYAFDTLTPVFGPDVMHDFVVNRQQSGRSFDALQLALRENAPHPAGETYFATLIEFLAAVNTFDANLTYDTTEAGKVFTDQPEAGWAFNFLNSDWLMGTQPGTVRVVAMERIGAGDVGDADARL